MVYFVGAGSGAVDLITVRGQRLLRQADVVIYAGSLVNPQLLQETRPDCRLYNSAKMTLEEVLEVIGQAEREGATIVRLHTGDPCLYGAIREQMDQLDDLGIAYEYVPGVSSFCAAAAALNAEYTLPDVSQTVIITRMAGRTPVPEKEEIAKLAAHQATMVIFLSTGLLEGLQEPVESLELRLNIRADEPREAAQEMIELILSHTLDDPSWRLARDNREGVRIVFDFGGEVESAWFQLRLSVHDPVMALNLESDVPGGVQWMLEKLAKLLGDDLEVDLGPLRAVLKETAK